MSILATAAGNGGQGFIRSGICKDRFDNSPVLIFEPWSIFAKRLTSYDVGAKDGPGFMTCARNEPRRGKGAAIAADMLCLDIEKGAPPFDDVVVMLDLFGWNYAVYTTHSHTPEEPRYRVVVPTETPLEELDRLEGYCLGLAQSLGVDSACVDKASWDRERLMYLPRRKEDCTAYKTASRIDGVMLHLTDLPYIAPEDVQKPPQIVARQTSGSIPAIAAFNEKYSVADVLERNGYQFAGSNRYHPPGDITGEPGVRLFPDSGRVYSHHANDPLNTEYEGHAHDAFDCFRLLEHDGDMAAALNAAGNEFTTIDPGTGEEITLNECYRRQKALQAFSQYPGISGELLEPLFQVAKGQPYPIDQLPPRMREAAQAIAYYVQAPLPLAGNTVIAAAAYLAQRLLNAPSRHGDRGEPCSLFMLTLGNSGDRKSSCRDLACKAIDELEKAQRQSQEQRRADIEVQAKQMRGKDREAFLLAKAEPDAQTLFTDATFESIAGAFISGASAGAWDTDEGGQMLGGYSLKSDTRTATLGGLVKAFDSGQFERNRSKANAEGSGVAYNRRLTVSLLAQEIAVRAALTDPLLQGQGFLPRFLFASTESLAGSRFLTIDRMKENAWSDHRLQRYWQRCRELLDHPLPVDANPGALNPPALRMDEDARRGWLDFYNETESEQAQGGDLFDLRPFASRAGQLASRLAAVFACFEGLNTIDAATMASACAFVRFSLGEWQRYAVSGAADPKVAKAQALIDWLMVKGISTIDKALKTRLGKEGPTRDNAKLRDEVIALLLTHRYLLPDGDLLRLNPQIHAGSRAGSVESGETRASVGSASAERVRKGAGTVSADYPPVALPHPPAWPPHRGNGSTPSFPQNPHVPQ